MWRNRSRRDREKSPPPYEETLPPQTPHGHPLRAPYGGPNGNYGDSPANPDLEHPRPGPQWQAWQQQERDERFRGAAEGYYNDTFNQPMYGRGVYPVDQWPYPAQGPVNPHGPGPHPRGGYYPQPRQPRSGFFEVLLASLACCCCLDLLIC